MKNAESRRYQGFFRPLRKNRIANILNESPTCASKAILENCMCQGEIANRNAESRESFLLLNNSLTRKYVAITVNIPKITEGSLTEIILSPSIFINGIIKYAYPAGL